MPPGTKTHLGGSVRTLSRDELTAVMTVRKSRFAQDPDMDLTERAIDHFCAVSDLDRAEIQKIWNSL